MIRELFCRILYIVDALRRGYFFYEYKYISIIRKNLGKTEIFTQYDFSIFFFFVIQLIIIADTWYIPQRLILAHSRRGIDFKKFRRFFSYIYNNFKFAKFISFYSILCVYEYLFGLLKTIDNLTQDSP